MGKDKTRAVSLFFEYKLLLMTVKDREGDSFHFKLSLRKIDSRTPFKHFKLSKIFKKIRDRVVNLQSENQSASC